MPQVGDYWKLIRERITQKVIFNSKTECWEWSKSRFSNSGYARLSVKGVSKCAHRISYEAFVGPIPTGYQVDHLCRVRHCVNPDHLEPVTPRENFLRGTSPAAINNRRKFCIWGHPLSGNNLYITKSKKRMCVACKNARYREYYQKNLAQERSRSQSTNHKYRSVLHQLSAIRPRNSR